MRTFYFANYRLQMDDAVVDRINCPLAEFTGVMDATHTLTVRAGDPRETEGLCRTLAKEKPACVSERFTVYRQKDGWAFLTPGTGYAAQTLLVCTPDYSEITLYTAPDGPIPFMHTVRPACETAIPLRGGLPLHAALVEHDGMGVLFLARSGVGKSTQALLWQKELGAKFLIGDRPTLRKLDGEWIGFSMPWDGKDNRRSQSRTRIRAIVTLAQADHNAIRCLTVGEATAALLKQAFLPLWDGDATNACLAQMNELAREIPFWHLENTADAESVRLTLNAITEGR